MERVAVRVEEGLETLRKDAKETVERWVWSREKKS